MGNPWPDKIPICISVRLCFFCVFVILMVCGAALLPFLGSAGVAAKSRVSLFGKSQYICSVHHSV